MTIKDIELPDSAGSKYIYALFRRKAPVFGIYSLSDLNDKYSDDELLELHIFDTSQEFRAFTKHGKPDIVTISDDTFCDNKNNLVFDDEEMLLEDEYCINGNTKLLVRNYYDYDENDLIILKGYRIIDVR